MQIDIAAFFLLLLFGCAAFVFGVVCLIGKTFMLIGRALGGFLMGEDSGCDQSGACGCGSGVRRCPRRTCGKIERRPARFCSQCGLRFPDEWG